MKYTAAALALATSVSAQSLQAVLANNTQLSQLANLASPYLSQLSSATNITLLAPDNAAIAAVLNSSQATALANNMTVGALLNYHVLQGSTANFSNISFVPTNLMAMAGYANVTGGQRVEAVNNGSATTFISGLVQASTQVNNSIAFDGGYIHIIDKFLTLPLNVSTTAVDLGLSSAYGALNATGLVNTVDTTADLTLFVPDNSAFQAIAGNLANLTVQQISSILTYHVVPQVLYSTSIMNGSSYATLNGANVTLRLIGSDVYVDSARVVTPNVLVANGVVHVIDRVLNPMNATATPNTSTTAQAFPSASSGSAAPYTSGVPTPTSTVSTSVAASAAGSSTKNGAWAPAKTGSVAMAALLGAVGLAANM